MTAGFHIWIERLPSHWSVGYWAFTCHSCSAVLIWAQRAFTAGGRLVCWHSSPFTLTSPLILLLCWLHSFQILPSFHFLISLSSSGQTLSPTTISTYPPPLSLTSPAVHPAPFVYSTLTSTLNQLSFTSLFLKPIALLLWLSLAAQCRVDSWACVRTLYPAFVCGPLPAPRSRAFLFSTMAFCCGIVQLSSTQREGKQTLCNLGIHTQGHYREREHNWR